MTTYSARDVANWSFDQVWNTFPDHNDRFYTLKFDDGDMQVRGPATVVSWFWWLFHRTYPELPMKMNHHFGNRRMNNHTPIAMSELILNELMDMHPEWGHTEHERLLEMAYCISNELHNLTTTHLTEYVGTLSMFDILDFLDHPPIAEALTHLKSLPYPTAFNIGSTQEEVWEILLKDPLLNRNGIAQAARGGMARKGSILGTFVSRGGVTDIDSTLFSIPIVNSVADGFVTLADSMKESRSASKAIYYQTTPMQRSEKFNRYLQLLGDWVMYFEDNCGTKQTNPYTIDSQQKLYNCLGKHYLEDGVEKIIGKSDTHLIGTCVRMFSPLTCESSKKVLSNGEHDVQTICRRCYGELHNNVPYFTNVGGDAAAKVGQITTAALLGVKHDAQNVGASKMDIHSIVYQFFKEDEANRQLFLKIPTKGLKLLLPQRAAPNLNDVRNIEDVNTLLPANVFRTNQIKLIVTPDDGIEQQTEITLTGRNSYVYPTYALLHHMRTVGWSNERRGYFIDLSGWDSSCPIFEYPTQVKDLYQELITLEQFITGSNRDERNMVRAHCIHQYPTPSASLAALHQLVSVRMDIPLSYLEVLVLSMLCEDPNSGDYRMCIDRANGQLGNYKEIMEHRDFGAAMSFEKQKNILSSVQLFTNRNRTPHPISTVLVG